MAASIFIRYAEDELSCPICFELFVDPNTPKTLPVCGHVCCELCLKKMVAGKCAQACPECRQIIKIPVDGVGSFPTNFRLRNLAEKHHNFGDEKLTSSREPTKKTGVRICPDHEGEKMHYFCVTCNALACQACLILKHRGDTHEFVGVKDKYEEQKIQMESAIAKTNYRIERAEDRLRSFQEIEPQVNDSHKIVEKQIDDVIASHMNALLDQGQRLKGKLQQAKGFKLENLNKELETIAKKIELAKTVRQVAVNALGNIPDYEYITRHTSLISDVTKLDIKEDFTFTSHAAANFVPKQQMNEILSVGTVRLETPDLKRRIKLIQTLDGYQMARNVAKANDLLVVCDLIVGRVTTYHKVSGKYEKNINLNIAPGNETGFTKDVAICPDGRFMVAKTSCIEVYSPQGNHQNNIQTCSTNGQRNVSCLEVTPSGRILSGDFARSVITENDQTGNIVRTLKTSIKPYIMTLVNDTHIAISSFWTGKVIVMDIATGQETLSIDIPNVQGVCYDEQTECLLIGRCEADDSGRTCLNTGVIEQYSYTTGKLVACLEQGLVNPLGMRMTIDGILAVTDQTTVKIYQIK